MKNISKEQKIEFITKTLDKIKEISIEGVQAGQDTDLHPWEVMQTVFATVYEQDLALSLIANQQLLQGKTKEQIIKDVEEMAKNKSFDEVVKMGIDALKDPGIQDKIFNPKSDTPTNVIPLNPNGKKPTVH